MTDIGRPHKIMTWLEYIDIGFKGPHIIEHIQDETGNVAFWAIDPVLAVEFDHGKEFGKEIGKVMRRQQAKHHVKLDESGDLNLAAETPWGSMTKERAISLYVSSSPWLRHQIKDNTKCNCGHCYLCGYDYLRALKDS